MALQVYEVYIWKLVPATRFIHDTITRIVFLPTLKETFFLTCFLKIKLSMIIVVVLHCYLKTPNYHCGAQQ